MKLFIYFAVVSVAYFCGMTYLIYERKTHPSKEERYENQSGPMMIGATLLFVALLVQGPKFIA